MTVYGRLTSERDLYALLDEENVGMVARGRANDPDSWPDDAAEQMEGQWVRHHDEHVAEYNKLAERNVDVDVDELSDEDERLTHAHEPNSVTLAEVHVFTASGLHYEVSVMRVRLALVAGWWPIVRDSSGTASFSHPTG